MEDKIMLGERLQYLRLEKGMTQKELSKVFKVSLKTIQFYDINYQLARNEDKNEIFENYCDFLNYFDQSISVQFSFLNQTVDMAEYEKAVHIPEQADNFNDIRIEYMGMLKNQLSRGNNGIIKRKFITFGIEADNLKAAKQKLERKIGRAHV